MASERSGLNHVLKACNCATGVHLPLGLAATIHTVCVCVRHRALSQWRAKTKTWYLSHACSPSDEETLTLPPLFLSTTKNNSKRTCSPHTTWLLRCPWAKTPTPHMTSRESRLFLWVRGAHSTLRLNSIVEVRVLTSHGEWDRVVWLKALVEPCFLLL